MMARVSLVFLIVCSLVVGIMSASTHMKRSYEDSDKEEPPSPCSDRMPCGWATYDKYNRKIENFTKNRCFCVGEKKCLRDRDDVSIQSYVYRCKIENPPSS